ncbi:FixH family protein [Owenweeksia hongkongensis]|uniref:FixH family protein n=1 Tax=Owenweeksia hongkongensis TaxID=253245 RepID=UPI003A91B61E
MKFNWGTGIALTLVLFAMLMGFMVYKAMQQDFDLVSEEYYADELVYQDIINQKTNALKLDGRAKLQMMDEQVFLMLPADLDGKIKSFEVQMYHEQEADNDFNFEKKSTTENQFAVPFKTVSTGKWIAKVKLNCEGVDYYFDPEIVF